MKATSLLRDRVVLAERAFADIKIWRVPSPVRGSGHDLKYSLSLVVEQVCVLRFDNEAGKGDHRHTAEGREEPYAFSGADDLVRDFWREVDAWMTDWRS